MGGGVIDEVGGEIETEAKSSKENRSDRFEGAGDNPPLIIPISHKHNSTSSHFMRPYFSDPAVSQTESESTMLVCVAEQR